MSEATTVSTSGRAPSKKKDSILLRGYLLLAQPPQSVKFSECMPKFLGLAPFLAAPDLLWGVQGTSSLNKTDGFASEEALRLNKHAYHIDLQYRLDELQADTGYLHFTRIGKVQRDQIRADMLKWLREDGDRQVGALEDVDFETLVNERPMLIHRLMTEQKHLNAIVHTVCLNGGVPIRIAVVRNIPDRITVKTRGHEHIPTIV